MAIRPDTPFNGMTRRASIVFFFDFFRNIVPVMVEIGEIVYRPTRAVRVAILFIRYQSGHSIWENLMQPRLASSWCYDNHELEKI
jgi:hypothetical protein